jgi:hypothetical protein
MSLLGPEINSLDKYCPAPSVRQFATPPRFCRGTSPAMTENVDASPRHCERQRSNPGLRQTVRRETLDCFVAHAPRNDETEANVRDTTRQVICPTGKNFVACENLSTPSRENIPLRVYPKSNLQFPPSRPTRGALRDRHGRWARDAMDAHRRARFTCADERRCADGEVVWSWRSDAGAKLVETIPLMTVATKHGHRGEREGNR